jgi:purine-nucleoside phosphorylase
MKNRGGHSMSNPHIPTPHIEAKFGEIAKTVLMPGDPLRAKFIAETYLDNPVCFNKVRGMLGFTGTYKGKEISVMGSGMGIPSIGIYSHELFNFYDVDNIIRIGTCGGFGEDIGVQDVILANKAYSFSSYAKVQSNYQEKFTTPSNLLNETIIKTANELGEELKLVNIASGDCFYTFKAEVYETFDPSYDVKAGEMESFGLFANAKLANKNAACLLTVSDKRDTEEAISSTDREKSLTAMFKIALESAIKM